MTSRPAPRKPPHERFVPPPRTMTDPGDGKFPVFSTRGDMQNPICLHRPGHLAALSLHLGSPETTLVLGEVPVGHDLSIRRGLRVPDLIIAFNVDPAGIKADRGYSIERWDNPPDFVLEIASDSTAGVAVTFKPDEYAAFGIFEYWRFDPTGGDLYGAPLAGDRLSPGGGYHPIKIITVDETRWWGHSAVLGLDLCWEDEQLRWYDPSARRYLPTFDEESEARIAAEERVRQLEAEIRRLQG